MNIGYKNDIEHYINITPVVDLKGFVTLLLADLASKTRNIWTENTKYAFLPMDYKNRIEQIMYAENGWGIKFSKLIDINEYYEKQRQWEDNLGEALSETLSELKKDSPISYNFQTDTISIPFTIKEISKIKQRYDNEVLEIMDHFSNLIEDYAFSREFKIDSREMDRNNKRRIDQHNNFLIYQLRCKGIKNPEKYLHF